VVRWYRQVNPNGGPVYAEYVEHGPPDPGAAKLWLTTRWPEQWRDKNTTELTGKDAAPIVPVLNVDRDDRAN
jgi:hypothetical protein